MTKRVIRDVSTTGKIPREKIKSVVSAVHVAPLSDSWEVRKSGKNRIAETFSSKEAAVDYARSISSKNGVDLIIHTKIANGCSLPKAKDPKAAK
jgi:hypothetical protein